MEWYLQSGKDDKIAVMSQMRFARDIKNAKWDKTTFEDIYKIEDTINKSLDGIVVNTKFKAYELSKLSDEKLEQFRLNGYIEQGYKNDRTHQDILILSDGEKIIIYLNPDTHLAIKVYNPGDNINDMFNLVEQIDGALGREFSYTPNKDEFYVHGNGPVNIDFNTKMFCPALTATAKIGPVMDELLKMGIYTRCEVHDIYKIMPNTKDTFYVSDAIALMEKACEYMVTMEQDSEKILKRNLAK